MKSIKIIVLLLFVIVFGQTMMAQAVGTPYIIGTIKPQATLSCTTGVLTGILIQQETIPSTVTITKTVPYTGGNGGSYGAISINSTGITGLTATLSAGSLVNGSGTLTFNITGTPSNLGNANFALTLGSSSCNFTANVISNNAIINPAFASGTANWSFSGWNQISNYAYFGNDNGSVGTISQNVMYVKTSGSRISFNLAVTNGETGNPMYTTMYIMYGGVQYAQLFTQRNSRTQGSIIPMNGATGATVVENTNGGYVTVSFNLPALASSGVFQVYAVAGSSIYSADDILITNFFLLRGY
jgi:hypothetical protein